MMSRLNNVLPSVSPRTIRNLKRQFRSSLLAKIGILLLVLVIFVTVFAPFLAPHDPRAQNLDQGRLPPLGFSGSENVTTSEVVDGEVVLQNETVQINATATYPLGTNSLGQDVLSRAIYGARTSLIVGLLGTGIAAVLGVTVGLIAGYYRGNVDDVLMRIADTSLAFPSLVLAIALVGLFSRYQADVAYEVPDPFVTSGLAPRVREAIAPAIESAFGVVISTEMPASFTLPMVVIAVVGIVNWVWFARIARGEALSISEEEYVKAARELGASDRHVLRRHVLPNAITPILVLATIQVAAIILLESTLSFLGFSGTTLSWGFDIAQGRSALATSWWVATIPGLAIVVAVIAINLVGDWLRDALDPGIEGEGGSQ